MSLKIQYCGHSTLLELFYVAFGVWSRSYEHIRWADLGEYELRLEVAVGRLYRSVHNPTAVGVYLESLLVQLATVGFEI